MKKIIDKVFLIVQVILFAIMFLGEITLAFVFIYTLKIIVMIPSEVLLTNKVFTFILTPIYIFSFLIFLIKLIPNALGNCLYDIIDNYKKIKYGGFKNGRR